MESYFRTTSYALVITAFLAIALTGSLDAISLVLYSIVVAVCFYRDTRGIQRWRLREWMWRTLSIGYVPFIFIDAALISNRVLALVHMTLFVSAAKLFQNKRDRDWVFLYLIAFFQMLLAAGLTFNATFVASLGAFLFFFISTLAAFEIRRAGREVIHVDDEVVSPLAQPQHIKYRARDHSLKVGRNNRVRYLLGASFAQIVIVASLTLPFFFLIPRFGGGGVAGAFNGNDAITGFSDRVELGQVAKIKKSPRIVMRIRLDRKPPRALRWRGVALNDYDGRAWTNNSRERKANSSQGIITSEGPERDAGFERSHVFPDDKPHNPASVIEQRIILEPVGTDTLFATRRPLRVRAAISEVSRDNDTDALTALGIKGRITYSVFSDISVPSEQELRLDAPATAREFIRQRYSLPPPPSKLDPRIPQLAHEITRNAPTPYDKARAIENYLKTSFHYTLDLKSADRDPLAEFLFQTREGHCEYFATAMVIMLRTLGIPARIVNGFQMGEYNELNDMYSVRESDAHSWVEAYFPKTDSWIEFDPTPAAGINDYTQGGLFAQLRKYADALEVFWLDYIVTLDRDEQASIMVDIQQRLLGIKDRLLVYYQSARLFAGKLLDSVINRAWSTGELIALIAVVSFVAVSVVSLYVILAFRKRRRLPDTGYGPWWHRLFILPLWRRRLAKRDYRQSAVLFYEQMLAIARRAGLVKQPDQTPIEFALASGLSPIREITTLYNRVRFGGATLDESETRRISELLGKLKQDVRSKRFK
jgi:transglutaminase-like putative cysteine protease